MMPRLRHCFEEAHNPIANCLAEVCCVLQSPVLRKHLCWAGNRQWPGNPEEAICTYEDLKMQLVNPQHNDSIVGKQNSKSCNLG